MPSPNTIREYALKRVAALLDQLVFEIHRAAGLQDTASVHNARIAIRRFDQSIRVFGQYLPHGACRKIQKKLKEFMDAAGEVRNRDITLRLMGEAPGTRELELQRKDAKRRLSAVLHRMGRPGLSSKWRTGLKLDRG
jgi:CHAD domain-containing protein